MPFHLDDSINVAVQPPPYPGNEAIPNSKQFCCPKNDQDSHNSPPITAQVKFQNTPHSTTLLENRQPNYGIEANRARFEPDTHLCYAVFTCICCCWPFGLAAIIYSVRCSRAIMQGKFEEARQLSGMAKLWAHFSLIAGIFITLIYVITQNMHE